MRLVGLLATLIPYLFNLFLFDLQFGSALSQILGKLLDLFDRIGLLLLELVLDGFKLELEREHLRVLLRDHLS